MCADLVSHKPFCEVLDAGGLAHGRLAMSHAQNRKERHETISNSYLLCRSDVSPENFRGSWLVAHSGRTQFQGVEVLLHGIVSLNE